MKIRKNSFHSQNTQSEGVRAGAHPHKTQFNAFCFKRKVLRIRIFLSLNTMINHFIMLPCHISFWHICYSLFFIFRHPIFECETYTLLVSLPICLWACVCIKSNLALLMLLFHCWRMLSSAYTESVALCMCFWVCACVSGWIIIFKRNEVMLNGVLHMLSNIPFCFSLHFVHSVFANIYALCYLPHLV